MLTSAEQNAQEWITQKVNAGIPPAWWPGERGLSLVEINQIVVAHKTTSQCVASMERPIQMTVWPFAMVQDSTLLDRVNQSVLAQESTDQSVELTTSLTTMNAWQVAIMLQ